MQSLDYPDWEACSFFWLGLWCPRPLGTFYDYVQFKAVKTINKISKKCPVYLNTKTRVDKNPHESAGCLVLQAFRKIYEGLSS